jgi:hypothetical protein
MLSFLEIRAERRQKSVSVELGFAMVFASKHHVSSADVIVLLTIEKVTWLSLTAWQQTARVRGTLDPH